MEATSQLYTSTTSPAGMDDCVERLGTRLGGPDSLRAFRKRKMHASRESSPSFGAYSLVTKLTELLRFIHYIGLYLISETSVCVIKRLDV
jgi:hypothetical protein